MGSHDFIQFPPDLGEFSSRTWLLLGEIQAKITNLGQVPIPPACSEELRRVYVRKGVHGTAAIEGNTLSEEEVGETIGTEMTVPPSRQYQIQEVRNIHSAVNAVVVHAMEGRVKPYSLELLHKYHTLLLYNLDEVLDKDIRVGEIRSHRVVVGRYRGAPVEECEFLVRECCKWLNNEDLVPDGHEEYALAWNVIKALVAHVYFAWIHPYGDGNGRMARLIEFDILLRAGVPDVAAHLLSNFYYLTVNRYWRELQDSHGEYVDGTYPDKGNLLPFIEYAIEGFRDSLNEQCLLIYNYQLGVIWHDLIHTSFPKRLTDVQQRQKRLAMDLTVPRFQEGVAFEDVRYVTPAVAESYAGKGDRTLYRDLEKLMNMNLIRKVEDEYRPNTELLFTFFANTRAKSD